MEWAPAVCDFVTEEIIEESSIVSTKDQQHPSIVNPTRYRSYLLRLWKETPNTPWRVHLQSVHTGEQHRFSDLEEMLVFLRGTLEEDEPDQESD